MSSNSKTASIFLVVVLFFGQGFVFVALCQQTGSLAKQITPQPPNVGSLLKFNEVPVNYYNGTADINVPLLDVDAGGVSMPITLRYHTGGIKVTEEASWVGLGWALQAGGVIQEIIVGEPDYENTAKIFAGDYSLAPKPYNSITYPVYSTSQASNLVENGLCYLDNNNQIKSYQINDVLNKNFEFDLYSFNFGSYSGKFVFLNNTNGTTLDRQNIEFTISNKYDLNASLTATTPDGAKYIFGTIGITSTPRVCTVEQPVKSRTWYLTEIIYPDSKRVIFTYYPVKTSRSLPTFDEILTKIQVPPGKSLSNNQTRTATINYSTVESYYLKDITFPAGKIDFLISAREDMENGWRLDRIRLFSFQNLSSPIKEINFFYSYFVSTIGDDWTVNVINSLSIATGCSNYYSPSSDFKEKRLKLTSLKISDPNNAQLFTPYSFEYSAYPMPRKTSLAQDLWGFNNGVFTNQTLLPNYNTIGYWDGDIPSYFLTTDPSTISVASRGANYNAQAGILTKIIYPTKGYSTFAYEPNSVSQTNVTQLVNEFADATNLSQGVTQVEFDVPNIGYVMNLVIGNTLQGVNANPVNILVKLNCCPDPPPQSTCASTGFCGPYDVNFPTRGLYAILERWSNNKWVRQNPGEQIYDFSTIGTTLGSNYSEYSLNTGLVPGHYRVTANYPDNAPSQGGVGSNLNQARILVTYKKVQTSQAPPMVAGLRVSNIKDFDYDGTEALQRNFAYSGGRMMTRPIFYSQFSYLNFASFNSADCPANHVNDNVIGSTCPMGSTCPDQSCACPTVDQVSKFSLYSTPVTNYSYSAQGGLVGYDKVTVTSDAGGGNGKTEYLYNNQPDIYTSNGTPPGIPSSTNMLNGSLLSEISYKYENSVFTPVKSAVYEYSLAGFDIKWCLKTEYVPRYVVTYIQVNAGNSSYLVEGPLAPTSLTEPKSQYIYFYPLKFGKLVQTKKRETVFDGTLQVTSETNYEYNNKYQVRRSWSLDSRGRTAASETYYPTDYTSIGDVLQTMRTRNMIDYPVENISRTDGLATDGTYTEYEIHGDLISPKRIFKFNTNVPVSLTASIPLNVKDSRYTPEIEFTYNSFGTLQQQKISNGINTVYLWGYNNNYPVAEIRNTSYDQVKTALAIVASEIDFGSGTLTAAQANSLRANLPDAFVSTYTYSVFAGISSSTDYNGFTRYYEYDGLQRLIAVKDKDGNILKSFTYNIKL